MQFLELLVYTIAVAAAFDNMTRIDHCPLDCVSVRLSRHLATIIVNNQLDSTCIFGLDPTSFPASSQKAVRHKARPFGTANADKL
jgi:hypothetical protein